MIAQWLNTVPFSRRLTLLLVMIGLIFSCFYAMVWEPTSQEINALRVNSNYLKHEMDRQRGRDADLAVFEAKLQHGRIPSPSVQEAVAMTGIPPRLMRKEVQMIMQDHGLLLALWQPMTSNLPDSIGGRHTMRVQGRIEGNYHEIAKGFEAILKMPWALEVNQLRLSLVNDGQVLSADFQLVGLVTSHSEDPQRLSRIKS